MRTLMISAHPEWVEKILNGDKTIEVRHWIPKADLPLEALIYVAKRKPYLYYIDKSKYEHYGLMSDDELLLAESLTENVSFTKLNGKVVAKFILNKAEEIDWTNEKISFPKTKTMNVVEFAQKTCLLVSDLSKYIKGKVGYAWHIDDLVIFDNPKELGEFGLTKAPQKMVWIEK